MALVFLRGASSALGSGCLYCTCLNAKNVLARLLLKRLRHSKYTCIVCEKKRVAVLTPGTKALPKGPYNRSFAVHCFIVVLLNVSPCATWHMPSYVLSQHFGGLIICMELWESSLG